MRDNIVAKIYAKSFIELAEKENTDLAEELTKFNEVINSSNELENVFFLDVFSVDEKMNIFGDISKKLNLSRITNNCVKYLIQEKRLNVLPLIYKEVVVIDDDKKGFLRGTIEGNTDSISDEYKNKLTAMIKQKINKEPKLIYKKNESISAGYKITVDDLQLDASIDNQLKQFKQSILGE